MTEPQPQTGIVYVASNPWFVNGIVKIGSTNGNSVESVVTRLNSLYRAGPGAASASGVPAPFVCEYAVVVPNYTDWEKALHKAFADKRINPSREFFEVDSIRVKAILDMVAIEDVTPSNSQQDSGEGADDASHTPRLPPINIHELGIPNESILVYKGDEKITCRVVGERLVEFRGKIVSPSDAAASIRGKNVSGSLYWMYEGETLDERRRKHLDKSIV